MHSKEPESFRRESTNSERKHPRFCVLANFDTLAEMAETDPRGFELLRTEICEEFILDAPEHLQARLRGIQFQVDMERRRSTSTMSACIRLSQMMNDALIMLNAVLEDPESFLAQREQSSAKVLAFKAAKPH